MQVFPAHSCIYIFLSSDLFIESSVACNKLIMLPLTFRVFLCWLSLVALAHYFSTRLHLIYSQIDYNKLAEAAGFKNGSTASVIWGGIKRKLLAGATLASASTNPAKKPRGKKTTEGPEENEQANLSPDPGSDDDAVPAKAVKREEDDDGMPLIHPLCPPSTPLTISKPSQRLKKNLSNGRPHPNPKLQSRTTSQSLLRNASGRPPPRKPRQTKAALPKPWKIWNSAQKLVKPLTTRLSSAL